MDKTSHFSQRARKPSTSHFSPAMKPSMSDVPISAPVAVRLSVSLESHRCQEGEGLRGVTIARTRRGLFGGREGGGGAFGASRNFSGVRYQGGTVWHTDCPPDEAVTKLYFGLSEPAAASYDCQISTLVWHLLRIRSPPCDALVCNKCR